MVAGRAGVVTSAVVLVAPQMQQPSSLPCTEVANAQRQQQQQPFNAPADVQAKFAALLERRAAKAKLNVGMEAAAKHKATTESAAATASSSAAAASLSAVILGRVLCRAWMIF